jgi:hypothetical protein
MGTDQPFRFVTVRLSPGLSDSQAENAGSIPVARSSVRGRHLAEPERVVTSGDLRIPLDRVIAAIGEDPVGADNVVRLADLAFGVRRRRGSSTAARIATWLASTVWSVS